MRHKSHRASSSERGISLMEMLVTVTLLAVVAKTATHNVSELLDSFDRSTARNAIEFDLRRARAQAAAQGTRTIFEIDADGGGYTVGYDYIPYSAPPAIAEDAFTRNLPTGITIATDQTIIIDSRGYIVDEGGELTQTSIVLSEDEVSYAESTLYPTGYFDYD